MKPRFALRVINALLFCYLFVFQTATVQCVARNGGADTGNLVKRVYVIRRPLEGQPLGSIRSFAHSALLLETRAGKYFVLEYLGDSLAHLTASTPKELAADKKRKVMRITMKGAAADKTREFEWERQLNGVTLETKWTPQQLQNRMQMLMKRYNVYKAEHCHAAQERLRQDLGLL